jgi:N-acetylneuraminic acid mutarotase
MNGSDTASTPTNAQPGIYGTKGVAAASNVPGARVSAVSWIDNSGNLWLFGGDVYDWLGELGILNDLWEFNLTSKEWTWVSGANQVATKGGGASGVYGVYGNQGVSAATNIPGARAGAASWIDSSGNLWLFGGQGYDSTGTTGSLNDLWEFDPSNKEWTWMSGATTVGAVNSGQTGIYGTQGGASVANVPGGRFGAVSWIDGGGNLWLFGGLGFASTQFPYGSLNDLWEFNPTTKEWTWMSGSSTLGAFAGQPGVYGTLDVPAANSVPGGRASAVSWIDSKNNLWLFGGEGYDSIGTNGYLNDLWEFNLTSNEWTWISGSSTASAIGVYGTLGTPAATNVPGGRQEAVSWIDSSGNLWMFGGIGSSGNFNDLWEFNPTSKEWTWVSGATTVGSSGAASGVYGTLGVPAATNVPEGRSGGVSWIDSSGNLWLFGGTSAYAYTGGELNDLWRYQP